MKKREHLALKAGDHLYSAIETLRELCAERKASKMSTTKYRRFAQELEDMARLLKTFTDHDLKTRE